ncbi:MAG: hypothetical protein ACI9ST_001458 [Psychrobacter glaciei]
MLTNDCLLKTDIVDSIQKEYSLKRIQCCCDEFFDTSEGQSTQQARKTHASRTLFLAYHFYFELVIPHQND